MMDLAGFDLNLLRVFAAIMQERSVTRAGERLGLSQPAVSAALNRLRHLLDDQLFVRRGNEMEPTPRAEDMIGPVRNALDQLEAALQGARRFDPGAAQRTFTLLGADYFSMLLMPALADRMARIAPGVRLRLLDSGRADIERQLAQDAVDVVLEGPLDLPDWVSRRVLFRSRFVVVARRDDPRPAAQGAAPGDPFPLDLFCDLPHALRTIEGDLSGYADTALAEAGRSRRVILGAPHFHGVLLAVARGSMIAAVPETFAAAFAEGLGLAVYRTPIPFPEPDIQMYWHSRHDRSPVHQWLRAQILELTQEDAD